MRLLYHFALQPFSRKVRIVLREKRLEFELREERPWERRDAFLMLNPAGEVPVLVEPEGAALVGSRAICEFLDETYPDPPMIGAAPLERAEVRRLVDWFDVKFFREVTANLLDQKIVKRLAGLGGPDSQALRAGNANIHYHLEYVAWLTDRRKWLAGDGFSMADATAAAHLSALDYIGDVPWGEHAEAKDWYVRVKSRPSFRPLLTDTLRGVPPPRHYADLDF